MKKVFFAVQRQPLSNVESVIMLPRYKKAEFEDEDCSSMGSIPAEAPMTEGPPSMHASGLASGVPSVGYKGHRRNLWQRMTPLEKLLGILVLLMLFVIIILSAVIDSHTSSETVTTRVTYTTKADQNIQRGREPPYCVTPACITVASSVLNAMDLNADPCADFYQYSCGGWIKSNPLPDGKSMWGTFGKLWQENQQVMKTVLENESISLRSETEKKARLYYYSCLDKNETIEKLGSQPMIDFLDKISGWNISGKFDIRSWNFQKTIQVIHNEYNKGGLFSWMVGEDERNSSRHVLHIDQGPLGLPSRDYFLNKSIDDEVLSAYLKFMVQFGVLLGGEENETKRQMTEVLQFEIRLANITIPADERRDDEQLYHNKTVGELNELCPAIKWIDYFNFAFRKIERKIKSKEKIVVYAPEYLRSLSVLLKEYLSTENKKVVLANYLAWSAVNSLISTLSKPFRDASKILRKALIGSEGGESPWRYCVTDTNSVIGFALGAMFVREVFQGQSKIMAEEMIREVRDAFKNNLPNLKWMDDETRSLAKEKADAITDMIGFPDFILDSRKLDKKYEGLNFAADQYFENNVHVNQFSLIRNMKQLDKAANKSEWEMTPSTINAYYTPTKNQIVFPAGILQAPFYDPQYPKSLNFGAMGVVMGHELTHAFDDQGREYDKTGNLHQWWNNRTIKTFQEQTKCVVEKYSKYEINGDHLNGKQTLGENIADNGGLKAAFHAYEDWLDSHPNEPPLPGLNVSHRQLFFLGFSQVWCSSSTPEAMRLQILNDAHSPPLFRVIGTLSNSKEFAREFNCKPGAPMNPREKCEVW